MSAWPRLRKLLVLALSTDNDNEALAALRKLRSQLEADGRDAHWLADMIQPAHTPAPAFRPMSAWREAMEFLSEPASGPWMNDREQEFILSLIRQANRYQNWFPTPKQEGWLRKIYAKVQLARRMHT